MIDTCHAAGVQVIVDTVINHMAGAESGEQPLNDAQSPPTNQYLRRRWRGWIQ